MTKKLVMTIGAGILAAALPAFAHHAPVRYALDKEVMLTGTVKEFRYTNPHSFIQILVPRDGGQFVEWRIETGSPIVLERIGLESTALQPGDKVTVRAHPLKDGRPSARLIDVTKADGTVLTDRVD